LETVATSPSYRDDATDRLKLEEDDMRRCVTVVGYARGCAGGGLTSAFAAPDRPGQTVVLGEHSLKGRVLDFVGEADYRPGDRYIYQANMTGWTRSSVTCTSIARCSSARGTPARRCDIPLAGP
jgi:hypothetical protein